MHSFIIDVLKSLAVFMSAVALWEGLNVLSKIVLNGVRQRKGEKEWDEVGVLIVFVCLAACALRIFMWIQEMVGM